MLFKLVLALAAKRVELGKSQTIACLDVSTAFFHAELRDEVYIKLDADTLRTIREENLPNLQPFDDECFYHDSGRMPCQMQRKILDSNRARSTILLAGSANFIQYVHVDDELLSVDDQLVRDMVRKLKQKFLVKKVDHLAKVGDTIEIQGRTVERKKFGYRLITSSRYIDIKASRTWTWRSAILWARTVSK